MRDASVPSAQLDFGPTFAQRGGICPLAGDRQRFFAASSLLAVIPVLADTSPERSLLVAKLPGLGSKRRRLATELDMARDA